MKLKPVSEIKIRLGIQEGGPAHKFFTSECFRYMKKYVPRGESSSLNENVYLGPNYITYTHPYAHYQWEGELYVDPITGKGSFYEKDFGHWSRPKEEGIKKVPSGKELNHDVGFSHWDEKMKEVEMKNIEKSVTEFVKRGAK